MSSSGAWDPDHFVAGRTREHHAQTRFEGDEPGLRMPFAGRTNRAGYLDRCDAQEPAGVGIGNGPRPVGQEK